MPEKKKPIKEELQLLQKDLEDLEWYIREFSSFLPISVCNVNPLGILIDVNQSFERLTGYTLVEVVGQTLDSVFLEKERIEKLDKEIQEKAGIQERGLTLVTKDKKQIPVTIWASQRKDAEGNYIGYFVGIIDITESEELKQTLENRVQQRTAALEKSAEELTSSRKALMNILEDVEAARALATEERNKTLAIITNFVDGLLVFDIENKLSLINPTAEDFLDIKTRDVIGRSVTELITFPTLKPLMKILGEEIRGIFRKELQIDELTKEVSAIPIMREKEEIGTLVILHDITREKIIERMKTEFVSITAHQLRTPLSAMKWILRMILDGDLGPVSETQKDFLEKTYISNERMIKLINDLLNVTRIEEGRFLYDVKKDDIIKILEKTIAFLKEVAQRKGLSFEFKKPAEKIPRLYLDRERITFAFQNLINNAIQYTKRGKIKVSLQYQIEKKQVLFKIQDTGIGIPKDQQKRVFTKFFRAANAIKAETEGTGLGLFIVKNVIEAHGGKIWFESEEDKGTTLYFTLPVRPEKEFEKFLVGF